MSENDPALSAEEAVSGDMFEAARDRSNNGAADQNDAGPNAGIEAVSPGLHSAPGQPASLRVDVDAARAFLKECSGPPRKVNYGLGNKVPFHGAAPGRDFTKVDCSGFVREAIWRATSPGFNFKDGSVVQHDWVRTQGFERGTVADGLKTDGILRIAFLPPDKVPSRVGHVVLIEGGTTIESHGGVGPDSRAWTGKDWQAQVIVYVLDRTGLD